MSLLKIGYSLIGLVLMMFFALPVYAENVNVNPIYAASCYDIFYFIPFGDEDTPIIYNIDTGLSHPNTNNNWQGVNGTICGGDTPLTTENIPRGRYSLVNAESDCYSLNYSECKNSDLILSEVLFTISTGGFFIPTAAAIGMAGQVSDQFADTGTLAIIGLSGIPLLFYVIRKFLLITPK